MRSLEERIDDVDKRLMSLTERVKGLESTAEERLRKLLAIEAKADKLLWVGIAILGSTLGTLLKAVLER